jgi:hypothetical protein
MDLSTVSQILNQYGLDHLSIANIHSNDASLHFWIENKMWGEAIDELTNQASLDLVYKMSPTLILHEPEKMIQLWKKFKEFNPCLVIPAMLVLEEMYGTTKKVILCLLMP